MPQMSPLYWLILFFSFSLIFMLFNMTTYYFVTPTSNKNKNCFENKTIQLNWKW